MEVQLLAFGVAKDIVGAGSLKLELSEEMTAAELKAMLVCKYEKLNKLKSFMLAINDEYAFPAQVIHAGDEVAVIPPVSGG